LSRMFRRSAVTTSEYGNRRFNDFVLYVADRMILDVTRVEFQASAA